MKRRRRGCSLISDTMHPQHANGTIVKGKLQVFGGVVMSVMDKAGAAAARDICANNVVTKKFKEIVFEKPVFVGDLLQCYGEVTAIGNTSITVKVEVWVVRQGERIKVTEGEAVFVSVDEDVKSIPVIGWNGRKPYIRRRKAGSSACQQPSGCTNGDATTGETPKS